MIHEMKLRPEYFDFINNGTKRKEELKTTLETFYTLKEQNEYGVLGIRIEK